MTQGYIRKRGKTFQVQVYAGRDPITGKRRYANGTAASKKEALTLRNRLLGEVGAGQHDGADTTFQELAEAWLASVGSDLGPSTLEHYEGWLRRHINPVIGQTAIRKLRASDLDRFYGRLRDEKGLAPASVRKAHTVIRSALRQAVRWGWVPGNVAADASPPRVPRPAITVPTSIEIQKLFIAVQENDPEFALYLRLATTMGARRGETVGLRWEDVDLDAGQLVIRHRLVIVKGGFVERDWTKTGKPRVLSLDAGTVAMMRDHLAKCQQAVLRLAPLTDVTGDSWTRAWAGAYLFSSELDYSRPWHPSSVSHRFLRLRRSVGIENVRLHDLRHHMATSLIRAGVPIHIVSERLGHASPATTLGIYTHFQEADDRDAADYLGKMVDGEDTEPNANPDADPDAT